MTLLRATVTFDYIGDGTDEAYGTEDPAEMARIDQQEFMNDVDFLFELMAGSDNLRLTVEPVE